MSTGLGCLSISETPQESNFLHGKMVFGGGRQPRGYVKKREASMSCCLFQGRLEIHARRTYRQNYYTYTFSARKTSCNRTDGKEPRDQGRTRHMDEKRRHDVQSEVRPGLTLSHLNIVLRKKIVMCTYGPGRMHVGSTGGWV